MSMHLLRVGSIYPPATRTIEHATGVEVADEPKPRSNHQRLTPREGFVQTASGACEPRARVRLVCLALARMLDVDCGSCVAKARFGGPHHLYEWRSAA
jgi:hypothetical protein